MKKTTSMPITIQTVVTAKEMAQSLTCKQAIDFVRELDAHYADEDFCIGIVDLVDEWMEDVHFAGTVTAHRQEKAKGQEAESSIFDKWPKNCERCEADIPNIVHDHYTTTDPLNGKVWEHICRDCFHQLQKAYRNVRQDT